MSSEGGLTIELDIEDTTGIKDFAVTVGIFATNYIKCFETFIGSFVMFWGTVKVMKGSGAGFPHFRCWAGNIMRTWGYIPRTGNSLMIITGRCILFVSKERAKFIRTGLHVPELVPDFLKYAERFAPLLIILAFASCDSRPHTVVNIPTFAINPDIQSRVDSHSFPKLSNQLQLCCRKKHTLEQLEQIHFWDRRCRGGTDSKSGHLSWSFRDNPDTQSKCDCPWSFFCGRRLQKLQPADPRWLSSNVSTGMVPV